MRRLLVSLAMLALALLVRPAIAQSGPDCSRPFTLGLHDHGLLYTAANDSGIDKDIAEELIRRSGCKIVVSLMQRARIWQLIEAGALDFSLSGITNEARDKFASFAWYFSNKYYLLVRRDAPVQNIADFEANAGLRIGIIRGFRYSTSANALVDKLDAAQRVSYSSGLEPLYELLLANRIQAMIIEPFDYPAIEAERIRDISSIIEFGDEPVRHGLIMARKSLSAQEQEKWRMLMKNMRADGTVRRIFEKYFPPEMARTLTSF